MSLSFATETCDKMTQIPVVQPTIRVSGSPCYPAWRGLHSSNLSFHFVVNVLSICCRTMSVLSSEFAEFGSEKNACWSPYTVLLFINSSAKSYDINDRKIAHDYERERGTMRSPSPEC